MTLRASTGAGIQTSNLNVGAGSQDGVTYSFAAMAFGGNQHISYFAGQTTINVAQVATTIFSTVGDGARLTICGSDGTNKFSDTLIYGLSDTPFVDITHTAAGSPSARTYTNTSGQLKLAMATGTYSTVSFGSVTGQR